MEETEMGNSYHWKNYLLWIFEDILGTNEL